MQLKPKLNKGKKKMLKKIAQVLRLHELINEIIQKI